MRQLIFIFVLAMAIPAGVWAQGNAFSFQGRLNDGTNPANGAYDLEFRLYPAIQGGTPIGNTVVSRPNTALVNGVFSVMLDFGATAFSDPNSVFIEIGVRPNGSPNAYTLLGPRQQLTVVPYAVRSMNSTNADNAINAQNAITALNAGNSIVAQNANNSLKLGDLSASEYVTKTGGGADFIRNSVTPVTNQNFNIIGNGFIDGKLSLTGSTAQNRDQGGFVKAMVYVDQFGVLVRCFNGITGSSTGNCGGIAATRIAAGFYRVDFPFQVIDRFISISPGKGTQVNLIASFKFLPTDPNSIEIVTNIADVTHNSSFTDDDFMLIVY